MGVLKLVLGWRCHRLTVDGSQFLDKSVRKGETSEVAGPGVSWSNSFPGTGLLMSPVIDGFVSLSFGKKWNYKTVSIKEVRPRSECFSKIMTHTQWDKRRKFIILAIFWREVCSRPESGFARCPGVGRPRAPLKP